ncbi:hypothetical protein [Corynebacterium liangguodongii]|uniref:Uncharacterized protein n=1 Tax=Corynebacterium liangguodongii TaxID=2079535 RepID=A0A2S0WBJ1_9CORY|nr:hypothetical protein [Corynebacterium liangguodongii]AWB83127.1 hypothetical protein C3E79_00340 [Corynebacterium liangguodongii]PWB99272.1 hypothetical protein DF219_06735 [Corynebacterium liangguodongii]
MTRQEFQFEGFLIGTSIFVVIPTVLTLVVFFAIGPKSYRPTLWKICLIGVLTGFFAAAAWLSWDPHSPMSEVLYRGAPTQFSPWQIVGCGATLIIANALTIWCCERAPSGVMALPISTTAGFATAFSFGVSFGVSTQEAVGIFLSYAGVGTLLLLTNTVWFIVLTSTQSP